MTVSIHRVGIKYCRKLKADVLLEQPPAGNDIARYTIALNKACSAVVAITDQNSTCAKFNANQEDLWRSQSFKLTTYHISYEGSVYQLSS
jgi:hypothetical protein